MIIYQIKRMIIIIEIFKIIIMKTDKIIFMKIINNIEMKMKIIKIKYYNKKIQIMLLINILTQKNMSNMKT
jgi:hypothetical protein